jgi:rhamnosyltransferase
MTEVRLSIVIRVRNEGAHLREVLAALAAQRAPFEWELIVVDNESTDDSVSAAEEHGAQVLTLGSSEFSYGRALNLGIERARGELVLLLSAHSLPLGADFLVAAVAPFDDPQIGAARCIDAAGSQAMQWMRPAVISYADARSQRTAEALPGWSARYPAATCCVIRRSVWDEERYDETLESNEDKVWASRALGRGWHISSCAPAMFRALRERSGRAGRYRYDLDQLELYRFAGIKPLPWPQFPQRVAVHVAANLRAGVRHAYAAVAGDCRAVTVPLRARRARRSGSLEEFATPGRSR